MKDVLDALLANSEWHALIMAVGIGAAESQGWLPLGTFGFYGSGLIGYAVLRFTGKGGKNVVSSLQQKRNQAYGGREVEK